jgi:hypothetical protein
MLKSTEIILTFSVAIVAAAMTDKTAKTRTSFILKMVSESNGRRQELQSQETSVTSEEGSFGYIEGRQKNGDKTK